MLKVMACPSLVVDKYGPFVVAQLLSAGLESARDQILEWE